MENIRAEYFIANKEYFEQIVWRIKKINLYSLYLHRWYKLLDSKFRYSKTIAYNKNKTKGSLIIRC